MLEWRERGIINNPILNVEEYSFEFYDINVVISSIHFYEKQYDG